MQVFYIRRDFWMSSLIESQGPYDTIILVESSNLDEFISTNSINVLVMDIEGAERDLLVTARLEGIDRVFLERGGRGISDQLISSGLLMKDRREDGKTQALYS